MRKSSLKMEINMIAYCELVSIICIFLRQCKFQNCVNMQLRQPGDLLNHTGKAEHGHMDDNGFFFQ